MPPGRYCICSWNDPGCTPRADAGAAWACHATCGWYGAAVARFRPIVGALLAQMVTWRLPFMLALLVGALAFLVTAIGGIVELTQRTSKVDPR